MRIYALNEEPGCQVGRCARRVTTAPRSQPGRFASERGNCEGTCCVPESVWRRTALSGVESEHVLGSWLLRRNRANRHVRATWSNTDDIRSSDRPGCCFDLRVTARRVAGRVGSGAPLETSIIRTQPWLAPLRARVNLKHPADCLPARAIAGALDLVPGCEAVP